MSTMHRYRLKHLAVIRVTGEQANAFLQGQLSNDLRNLTTMRAQLSSLNSAKGRVQAVLQLARFHNEVLMVVPAPIAASVITILTPFILRTRVQLQVAPELNCIGLTGPDANRELERVGGVALESEWSCTMQEKWVAWRIPARVPRIIVVGDAGGVNAAFEKLSNVEEDTMHSWRAHDILARIPEILPPTQDKFVAQMLALDDLGAIDFDKGCYTGQEIIARARYLGEVKRTSAVGETLAKRPLKPAEVLKVDDKPAALVVSSAPHPDGSQLVLAVVNGKYPPGTLFRTEDGIDVNLAVGGDPSQIQSLTLRFLK